MNRVVIRSASGMSVEIERDSKSAVNGKRLLTWVLVYPRFIHSEFLRHRQLSNSVASSRAIPLTVLQDLVWNTPASPVYWGKNKSGMSAAEELTGLRLWLAKFLWRKTGQLLVLINKLFGLIGLHKQIANRILESHTLLKEVCTATEVDNLYALRIHADAQPEIHELVAMMYAAQLLSEPQVLQPGSYHVPFVDIEVDDKGNITRYYTETEDNLTVEEALKVSASCSAQTSFRKSDSSLKKALAICKRLIESTPKHASPYEHQGTPMNNPTDEYIQYATDWEEGVTHLDRDGNFWSGNLQGWIQARQLIKGHVCYKYEP